MELWIARSEAGWLTLYQTKPHKEISMFTGSAYWNDGLESFKMDDRLFPKITFENSPQKIRLEIVKEEEV